MEQLLFTSDEVKEVVDADPPELSGDLRAFDHEQFQDMIHDAQFEIVRWNHQEHYMKLKIQSHLKAAFSTGVAIGLKIAENRAKKEVQS